MKKKPKREMLSFIKATKMFKLICCVIEQLPTICCGNAHSLVRNTVKALRKCTFSEYVVKAINAVFEGKCTFSEYIYFESNGVFGEITFAV